MSEDLRGAMIGAGYFSAFQAEAWSRIPGVKILAVADSVPGKAPEFAMRWSLPGAYTSAEEMVQNEKPDFVDIVTRPESHRELAEMAARQGVHVICQKPMASTWEECLAMTDACKKANVRLIVHENWRWQPWYREVKHVMDSGSLGTPYHMTFRMRTGDGLGAEPYKLQPYFREMQNLLIFETAVHHLDTSRFLAGEISRIYCQTRRINPVIRGEDLAEIHLSFVNGMQGLIDANNISGKVPSKAAMGSFRVEGDRGMIRLTSSGRLFLTEHGKEESPYPSPATERGYRGDSVRAAQEHYLICLKTGLRCESEGEEYLNTVAAVEACYRSAETGQVVSLATKERH